MLYCIHFCQFFFLVPSWSAFLVLLLPVETVRARCRLPPRLLLVVVERSRLESDDLLDRRLERLEDPVLLHDEVDESDIIDDPEDRLFFTFLFGLRDEPRDERGDRMRLSSPRVKTPASDLAVERLRAPDVDLVVGHRAPAVDWIVFDIVSADPSLIAIRLGSWSGLIHFVSAAGPLALNSIFV